MAIKDYQKEIKIYKKINHKREQPYKRSTKHKDKLYYTAFELIQF